MNSELEFAQTFSVVVADIIHQNAQLIGDLGEQLIKRLLIAFAPAFISILLFTGLTIYENIGASQISNMVFTITY